MDNSISTFIGYLTDKKIPFNRKFFFAIFIVFSLLFVDDYWGFSFNYNTNQKLEQYKLIEELNLEKNFKDPILLLAIRDIRNEVINRETVLKQFIKYTKEKYTKKQTRLNLAWWLISSSALFILIFLFAMFSREINPEVIITLSILLFATNVIVIYMPIYQNALFNYVQNFAVAIFTIIFLVIRGYFLQNMIKN